MLTPDRRASASTSSKLTMLLVSSPSVTTAIACRRTSALLCELAELLQRDVNSIVERRRAPSAAGLNRALEGAAIRRERLQDPHAVVEAHDRAAIAVAERLQEADGCLMNNRQLVAHARAAIQQYDQIDGHGPRLEELDVLGDAVLEDGEVRWL
jgi:hypothetical protein